MRKGTSCMANNGGGGGCLGMHKHSQTISKMKPKIRIIHIFAPQIIKTDVKNFRHLVQSLTGKPSADHQNYCKNINPTLISESAHVPDPRTSRKMELRNGFLGLDQSRNGLIKQEEEEEEDGPYNGDIDIISCRYLGGLEGFISEFGDFPLLPNWDAAHRIQEFQQPLLS